LLAAEGGNQIPPEQPEHLSEQPEHFSELPEHFSELPKKE
jgi:hypothetical protein